MEELIEKLHTGGYSCVIEKEGKIRTFTRRGVADLYDLYENEKAFMQGARIADKVIGKGAAYRIGKDERGIYRRHQHLCALGIA